MTFRLNSAVKLAMTVCLYTTLMGELCDGSWECSSWTRVTNGADRAAQETVLHIAVRCATNVQRGWRSDPHPPHRRDSCLMAQGQMSHANAYATCAQRLAAAM